MNASVCVMRAACAVCVSRPHVVACSRSFVLLLVCRVIDELPAGAWTRSLVRFENARRWHGTGRPHAQHNEHRASLRRLEVACHAAHHRRCAHSRASPHVVRSTAEVARRVPRSRSDTPPPRPTRVAGTQWRATFQNIPCTGPRAEWSGWSGGGSRGDSPATRSLWSNPCWIALQHGSCLN